MNKKGQLDIIGGLITSVIVLLLLFLVLMLFAGIKWAVILML